MSLASLRAQSLAKARAFFAERSVLEVDCGALVLCPPIDPNIDVMSVAIGPSETAYLHTSPEYAMKQLLAQGSGDIYFLGHVYRKGEIGRRHSPEFTMAEWYRVGFSFSKLIDETCDFIAQFTGPLPQRRISYREAFQLYAGINYSHDSISTLLAAAEPYISAKNWKREELLHLLLTHVIEPQLGQNEITVLIDYPPYEAALACIVEKNGEPVAERFEIYIQGLELANGYHELSDAQELRQRFQADNKDRLSEGKEPYALDEKFLSSLQSLPDCCGVSVGFDRVLMLRHNRSSIAEVILSPF